MFDKWIGQKFWLTRFVFVRALGFIYFVAFLGVLKTSLSRYLVSMDCCRYRFICNVLVRHFQAQ